jgi:hypothetical protein
MFLYLCILVLRKTAHLSMLLQVILPKSVKVDEFLEIIISLYYYHLIYIIIFERNNIEDKIVKIKIKP